MIWFGFGIRLIFFFFHVSTYCICFDTHFLHLVYLLDDFIFFTCDSLYYKRGCSFSMPCQQPRAFSWAVQLLPSPTSLATGSSHVARSLIAGYVQ
ncbi:hypothetical protein BJ508DRAFT_66039 [Ascobolus immersus RN42]|uniref:Uncharacterized protein n=1 Tax=Ascobolus immersus RN42 TaxID=1160509 RepID=A0A3N4IPB2_ASCIM|nr:hypothetical protein BJ508DRAFT_66039 [Ascobolus immersus RN42]